MWLNSFKAIIEKNTDLPADRMFYLSKYTASDAKDCIQGYLTLYNMDAYYKAKATLLSCFGNKYRVSNAYKQKLDNWPNVKPGDGEVLQKLSDFLWQCNAAMSAISHLTSLDSAEENQKLLRKLPRYITDRWSRVIDTWLHGTEADRQEFGDLYDGRYPPFSAFCRLLSNEARVASGPGNLRSTEDKSDKGQPRNQLRNQRSSYRKAGSFSTQTASSFGDSNPSVQSGYKRINSPRCPYCKWSHPIEKCFKFQKLSTEDRKSYARENGLCFGCLHKGHRYFDCKRKNPSLLNDSQPP